MEKSAMIHTTPAKRLLKPRVAAEVYGVTTLFLHRVPMDKLPRIKLGHRTVVFDVNDLEAFFKTKRVG